MRLHCNLFLMQALLCVNNSHLLCRSACLLNEYDDYACQDDDTQDTADNSLQPAPEFGCRRTKPLGLFCPRAKAATGCRQHRDTWPLQKFTHIVHTQSIE